MRSDSERLHAENGRVLVGGCCFGDATWGSTWARGFYSIFQGMQSYQVGKTRTYGVTLLVGWGGLARGGGEVVAGGLVLNLPPPQF